MEFHKNIRRTIWWFGFLLVGSAIDTGVSLGCQNFVWEKLPGMRPETGQSNFILYTGIDSEGIVERCFDRCRKTNCTAFVIDLERSGCFSLLPDSEALVPEPNATFFHMICLNVPVNCMHSRFWQVERTLGAVLIDTSTTWLPNFMNRSECYEKCIRSGDTCKSAQFRTNQDLQIGDTVGRCALSTVERGTRPQAYRASMYRDEYLQSQCHNISRSDYCSFSQFQNQTTLYSDARIPGLDFKECEERCDSGIDGFICRAYTIDHSTNQSICLLHSDDLLSVGVSSLITKPEVTYREREPCLELKVQCDNSTLKMDLATKEPFWGRVYVNGWGNKCGTVGSGQNLTVLALNLPKRDEIMSTNLSCGLTPAFSVDNQNRTRAVIWTTVIVQFNPIIQRLGDQAVRVGCSLDEHDIPEPRNITVQSSVSILDPNAGVPPISTTVVNSSSESPIVTMRIFDDHFNDKIVTQLGQKLILKIQITPPNGPYDIMAGHLVASSAARDSSYLLLDEMGCPTDPGTFPALRKDPTDNRSLIARFTTFKFPNSQLVRFNVVVKFCLDTCEPARCRGGSISYGRRRRSVFPEASVANVSEIPGVAKNQTPEELPLQLSIIVQSPVISADPLLSTDGTNPDTILIAGGQALDGLLCVDASLALGLLIFWLIIQIALTIGCLVAVKRYRRLARRAEEDRADILARHLYGIHGGNFEVARRVRWADHNGSSIS
ncbi:uncharacterized protein LOC107272038 [Cephus cinctus]|uniref:Uncharacterized protein LOC107272038 n=1 Tax=Cephus cinctus TaxID=211228 RepID=A0AAJ7C841_CEPCN|nr:uncharacterized protein LOC107272038 [Cephus cinctus]